MADEHTPEDTKKRSIVWNWKLSAEQLEEQVTQYSTLPITKSYRGQSTLLYVFKICLTLMLGHLGAGGLDLYSALASVVVYSPFILFTYLGHRWAMILLITLETVDRLLAIGTGVNGMVILVWWAIFVSMVYRAYQVEKERDKRLKNITPTADLIH